MTRTEGILVQALARPHPPPLVLGALTLLHHILQRLFILQNVFKEPARV